MRTSSWLLLGAAAGAVALLLTTERGKKIRHDISDNLGDWKDQLGKMTHKGKNKLKKMATSEMDGLSNGALTR